MQDYDNALKNKDLCLIRRHNTRKVNILQKIVKYLLSGKTIPTNTPRGFHVEKIGKEAFQIVSTPNSSSDIGRMYYNSTVINVK